MTIQTLIDKAAEKVGNPYKLSKVMHVSSSQIYDWRDGRKVCSPPDRARLASFAGDDPLQELVRATLEKTEGTFRGEQLKIILGKLLHPTGADLHSVVLVAVSVASGMMAFDIPRCIKSIVLLIQFFIS